MDILTPALKGIRSVFKMTGKFTNAKNEVIEIPKADFSFVPRAKSEYFSLGFSKESILPPDVGTKKYYVAGYGDNNPAQGVLDAPHTHAVWIDDHSGKGGIVIISIDCVGMLNSDVNILRERLKPFAMRTGCRSINVFATHNHAGIDTMGIWGQLPLSGRNPRYMELVFSKSVKAVKDAYENRKQGLLYHGKTEVPDMQEDIRLPIVYSKTLTRLRFVPNDGSKETYIINFASHSESLQGCNSRISADFPCYMRERIAEKTGANTLYCVGAIGGMISMEIENEAEIKENGSDFAESTRNIGRKLADYALAITDEKQLAPKISCLRQEFYFEIDNTVLMLAAKAGILKAKDYHMPGVGLNHMMKSELSYIEIDSLKFVLIPGEIFPELVFGGYLSAEESAQGYSPEINSKPLVEIADDKDIVVVGLANDEVGYIIPLNDYLLDEKQPYAESPRDRLGRRHYEETNSLGPATSQKIADVFADVIRTVNKAKNEFNGSVTV